MDITTTRRWRDVPPAWRLDLPVAAVLLVCWLLVPVAWAHLLVGLGMLGVVMVHLRTRPGRQVGRRGKSWGLAARHIVGSRVTAVLVVLVVASTLTGLLRAAGLSATQTYHGAVSYLLLIVAMVHIWRTRGLLGRRLHRCRQRHGTHQHQGTIGHRRGDPLRIEGERRG